MDGLLFLNILLITHSLFSAYSEMWCAPDDLFLLEIDDHSDDESCEEDSSETDVEDCEKEWKEVVEESENVVQSIVNRLSRVLFGSDEQVDKKMFQNIFF
jgi:hypothetical protein